MQSISSRIVEWIIRHTGVKKRNNSLLPKRIDRDAPPPNHVPPKKIYDKYNVEECQVQGQRLWLLGPKDKPARHWIFYVHGGAFVDGMMPAHWLFLGRLVKDTDALIAVPDYPLAPKANASQAIGALLDCYQFFHDHAQPHAITCMGDSSGGGMSVVLAQQLLHHSAPSPSQLILFSPWLDVSLTNPRIEALDKIDPFLGLKGLRSAAKWYTADLGKQHPLANSLYGELSGLPPVTLFIGGRDILQPDCEVFRDAAQKKGVQVDYHCFPDMLHLWMFLPVKEAKTVYRETIGKLTQPHPDSEPHQ